MASLSFIAGVAGNVISVLFLLSPVPTFSRIVKHRSTENFESLPYISALLTASLWFYYGVTKPDSILIVTVNGFGIIFQLVYVTLFLVYASTRLRVKTAILVVIFNLGFPACVVLITHFAMKGALRLDVIGFVCAVANTVMYGSPFAAMKRVVTTKSVEYMPFLLSFFLFLNGAIWTFYAVLVEDFFVGVPSGIGFILGAAQLLLYAMFWRSTPSQTEKISDKLDDGWEQKLLIHENRERIEV